MRRRPQILALGIALFFAAGARPVEAASVAMRDAATGAAVAGSLSYEAETGAQAFSVDGRLRALPPLRGGVAARASADGYRPLAFTLDPDVAELTLLLDPLEEPRAYRRLAERAEREPERSWLQGYVRDVDDGSAVAGAELTAAGRSVRSDRTGYFELELPAVEDERADRPALWVIAAGYGDHRRDGLLAVPGVQRLVIALDPARSTSSRQTVGALDRGEGAVGEEPGRAMPLQRESTPVGALLAPGVDPPPSIRVGFADAACTQSCCTASCTHTCTLSLETYVRRGLDNEWIASWRSESLRSGSIAYRSYGAWRVAHPIRGDFDICSSACCQVNDGSTHSSTDAAVARTPGILLTRDGSSAASSEYSAENNSWDDPNDGLSCSNGDLSCGDGYAGSPAAGWPCLADPVGAGHGCFGHGRGMSQWGTQRWALDGSAPRWTWIVDHYYNDNGAGSGQRTAVMTSPLSLAGVLAVPSAPTAGSSFQIVADATNSAGAEHPHLLIGASLYRSGLGYIDDSAHDAPLSLAPGTHAIGREFAVPATLDAGSFSLLVSLYLDVDENGAITGADLPLALVTVPDAVQVVADDRIFVDGFDGAP